MIYKVARKIVGVRGIIIGAVGGVCTAVVASLLTTQTTDVTKTSVFSLFFWLARLGFLQWLIIVAFVLFLALFLFSTLLIVLESRQRYRKGLQFYLKAVLYDNERIGPRGATSQSLPLIFVDLPLDDVFIPLLAVADKPTFNSPSSQISLIEELLNNPSVSDEEREGLLRSIDNLWSMQSAQITTGVGQDVGDLVFSGLDHTRPAAIILGSPGSGKSTVLRWLALSMARGWLSPRSTLPATLAPLQIPILIPVSEYASRLSQEETLTFRQFLSEYLRKLYPEPAEQATALLNEFAAGNCLLLLDGLDEASDDALRRRVAKNVYTFIHNDVFAEGRNAQHHNRFVISSRIASYEPGELDHFVHYTLCDLSDEQIRHFLEMWCPAVERHQFLSLHKKGLTDDQILRAERSGTLRYQQLTEILDKNPNIKRLAVSPLMLTILALIHRQGIPLPQRRVDLYRVVTRTLLESWNRDNLHPVIPREEIQLAEIMLSNLAYRLHTTPVLNREEAITIAHETMFKFYQLSAGQVSDSEEFIDKLRVSSGLFVRTGPGLYSFMHRTFREYFVALYLRPLPIEELKQFINQHYASPAWNEPLLLLIAYKGGSTNLNEVPQANDLIDTLAVAENEFDDLPCQRLLFAANSIIDCNAWLIDKELQRAITYRLLERYGDCCGSGRFTQLQQDIERTMLLWLRAQPQTISQRDLWPALLDAWRTALSESDNVVRQEGATRLLAILAPELASCPIPVMQALLPPLLSLAHLEDSPGYPDWVVKDVQRNEVQSASYRVQDYACIALRRLDAAGPAGWLRDYWVKEQSREACLRSLAERSQECGYLLTPASLPNKKESSGWELQRSIRLHWREKLTQNEQRELLLSSETVRYAYTYLLEHLFRAEQESPSAPWGEVWYRSLRDEMARGHSATYQLCLALRLMISRDDSRQRQETIEEFMTALAGHDAQHEQALLTIIHLYVQDIKPLRHLQYPLFLHHTQFEPYVAFLQQRQQVQSLFRENASKPTNEVEYLEYMLRYLPDMQELQDRQDLISLRHTLQHTALVDSLCDVLKQRSEVSPLVLLALYCLFTSATQSGQEQDRSKIQESLRKFERKRQAEQVEHKLLLAVLHMQVDAPRPVRQTGQLQSADAIATALSALSRRHRLSAQEVELLLNACANIQPLSRDAQKKFAVGTVHQLAYGLLTQPFSLETAELSSIVSALDATNALRCAGAALLLCYNKSLSQDPALCSDAARKIVQILRDVPLSCRLLDPPDNSRNWRLDDILFETLRVIGREKPI